MAVGGGASKSPHRWEKAIKKPSENTGPARKLDPALSSYLDFLRLLAAFAVVLGHMKQDGFNIGWMPLSSYSHEAVVVFFVLSGFIIYASTAYRQCSAAHYAVARLSRVYSVALPAIAFSMLLSAAIAAWNPQLARALTHFHAFDIKHLLGSTLFLNQSWDAWKPYATTLTLNGPFWSLCYEVWYYVVFGLFFFMRNPLWRWAAAAVALAIAGPAIAVLFPIWCMGAWLAANWHRLPRPAPALAWTLFIGSFALVVAIDTTAIDMRIKDLLHDKVPGFWRLTNAQRFVTDHLIGVAMVAQIWAFPALGDGVRGFFERHRNLFTQAAGFSFSLYLIHRPLTTVSGKLLADAQLRTVPVAIVSLVAVVGSCWLASLVTERKLPQWRRAIGSFVHGGKSMLAGARQ